MSRVAEINKELDALDSIIVTIEKEWEGKAFDENAATRWRETLGKHDKLTAELAEATTREAAVKGAAERIAKRTDQIAVNRNPTPADPDRQPGKGDLPEVFAKAFNGHSSIGEAFVKDSDFLAQLADFGIKQGDLGTVGKRKIETRPVTIEGVGYKALLTSSTNSAGNLYRAQRLPNILEILREPVRVTDLFPTIPVTGTNAVEYVTETLFANNAAVVPEATSATDDAALKPESELTFGLETDTLELIAHLIPATRQILADAPQLRAMVDSRLRVGLLEKLEQRVVATIYAASGLQTQAVGSYSRLDSVFYAMQKVRVGGHATPESLIIHPNDWTDIRLAKDLNGQYLMGSPSVPGLVTVFGIPVVDTQWATEGTPLVGDWSMFGALYEREQIQTYVTDSHKDWFQRNLIAILMELRALLAVYRASSACKITGW